MRNRGKIDAGKELARDVRVDLTKRVHSPISVSFQRIAAGANFCLSMCSKDEVKETMDCLRQLTTLSWQQVIQSGGKGPNKAGLGFTSYEDSALKSVARPVWLSEDIKISAVRASQKMRIFGVYREHIFYVLWFDRNHEIVSG